MVSKYSTLQDSIASAVQNYETYKSQYNDLPREAFATLPSLDLHAVKKSHAKKGSTSDGSTFRSTSPVASRRPLGLHSERRHTSDEVDQQPSSRTSEQTSEFSRFIDFADSYEAATYLIDLEFLVMTLNFMRHEHPHTNNSMQKYIKSRNNEKRTLWQSYTKEMQALARAFAAGKPSPQVNNTSPLSHAHSFELKAKVKDRRLELAQIMTKLESRERTCAESIFSALSHLHSQAMKDTRSRYSMPDPINDKTTPVIRYNERASTFNRVIKFVVDDLKSIERSMAATEDRQSMKKGKKGPGVVEAIESLAIEDYPPYK